LRGPGSHFHSGTSFILDLSPIHGPIFSFAFVSSIGPLDGISSVNSAVRQFVENQMSHCSDLHTSSIIHFQGQLLEHERRSFASSLLRPSPPFPGVRCFQLLDCCPHLDVYFLFSYLYTSSSSPSAEDLIHPTNYYRPFFVVLRLLGSSRNIFPRSVRPWLRPDACSDVGILLAFGLLPVTSLMKKFR